MCLHRYNSEIISPVYSIYIVLKPSKGWHSNKFQNGTDRVEIFHWPGEEQQMKAYDECIRHIQHLQYQDHFWITFIDLDEFIVIKDIETYPFILDYLETIPPNVGGLTVN